MLDSLVEDRVEGRRNRSLYAEKTKRLKQLNEELLEEACDMEGLLEKRRELEKEMERAMGQEGGVLVMEELKVALEALQTDIRKNEVVIERITRELDLLNTDLEELSGKVLEGSEDKGGMSVGVGSGSSSNGTVGSS